MTFDELNIVRKLKKEIEEESKKLSALKLVIGAFPHKYCKSEEKIIKSGMGKSDFENYVINTTDTEKKIEELQNRLSEEVPKLTEKIQKEVKECADQTLLIYRYVACEYFRDIGFLMGYSEAHVYFKHRQILKKLLVDTEP